MITKIYTLIINSNKSICHNLFKIKGFYFVFFILALSGMTTNAQNPVKLFMPGSYIIDMGQTPQTNANGLKPYGLVYQLIIVEGIPVNWAISSTKTKDGIDFTADGKNYSGGSFIIKADRISPSVLSKINTWKGKGVVVDGPIVNSFFAPVYQELTSWPRAVIDAANDQLISPFYTYAEVPAASYVLNGNPSLLTNCGDMYVLPHADPDQWPSSWLTGLKNFINNGGYLWTGCHAVSVLENIPGCNFLSNDGLIPYGSHSDGTVPFTYYNHSDPVMQFIGTMDVATQNSGSERIYLPKSAGWRTSTTLAVIDPDHPQTGVGKVSPGPAVACAYGYAFGDTSKGMVMYQAGHNVSSSGASSVAFGRAYFNFLLMAGVQKKINIDITFPSTLNSGSTYPLNATVSGGIPPYTYLWSSEGGGSFSSTTTNPTNFTPPSNYDYLVLKFKVTDACGRVNFSSVVFNQDSIVGCIDDAVQPTPPLVYCGPGNTNPIVYTNLVVTYEPNPITCEGHLSYRWQYIDCGGVTRYWEYIYTIDHLIVPIVPPDVTTSVSCFTNITPPNPPEVMDQCGILLDPVLISVIDSPSPIICQGTRTYNYTYTDCSGLSSNWKYIYNVNDSIEPTITCPADINIPLSTGSCSALVSINPATAIDNCDLNSISGVRSDLLGFNEPFPAGITNITWTAIDNCSLFSTCIQTVTVEDNENPSIICPANITVSTDANVCSASNVSLGTPSVDDNCTVANITNNAPSVFPIGTTIVTWTVTDAAGNTATCDQTVTVEDNENPSIICPANLTVSTDANVCSASNVSLGTPSVDDNCTVANITNNAPSIFPIGTTIVTWIVTDAAGNTATCNQTVTVEDNENPTIICPANITVSTDANVCSASNVSLGTPSVDDNCTVANITNNAPSVFPIGTTIVTWTVTDAAGN
ncbi:MAG: HYR domain-containing protein, partial [Bacteroidales bacterium]|nr:HYR domain-containing protein [Bacteroidales bacterium]